MGFEPVDSKNQLRDGQTRLHVNPGEKQQYISAAAYRAYFDGTDVVSYAVDREQSRLALIPGGRDDADVYALTRTASISGAHIHARRALAQLGIQVEALAETWYLELERDDETGYVVADCAALVEAATDAVHCEECGKRCAGEPGLNRHINSTHDSAKKLLENTEPDEIGDPIPPRGDAQ